MPDPQQIQGLPEGAILRPHAAAPAQSIKGLPPGAVVRPVQADVPSQAAPTGPGSTPGAKAEWPSLGQAAKDVGRESVLGAASGAGIAESQHPLADTAKGFLQLGQDDPFPPFGAAYKAAKAIAQNAVGAGKDIYQGYEQKDPGLMAHGASSGLTQALMLKSFKGHMEDAGRGLDRAAALNKGQVSLVNNNIRTPLSLLDHAVNTEIGKHANAVINADEMDSKVKNTPAGQVNAQPAAQAARDFMGKTFKPVDNAADHLITRAETGPLTMREAKAMTTDVGRMANSLTRAGRLQEAGALDRLYDGLHDATQARADKLNMGKSWSHYIDETSAYKQMQRGLLGDIQSEPIHAKVLDMLNDPKRAAEVSEITDKLKQYGVDPKSFTQAKEMGARLTDLTTQNKNVFIGKMRALIRHPMTAGPAAAGAAVIGSSIGVPGAGFVLPLIVAGKVAGILDATDVAKLVKQIEKSTPPGFERVHPPGEGPMPVQQPPGTAPSQPPSAGGGPSNPQSLASMIADMRATSGMAKKVADAKGQGEAIDTHPMNAQATKASQISKIKTPKARWEPSTQAPKKPIDNAPNPTPQRQAKVWRGAHGPVDIEFPDEWHKDLFSAPGRSFRQASQGMKGTDPGYESLASHFGVSRAEIVQMARDYKQRVMGAVKDKPEGTRYVAPSQKEIE